MKSARAVAVRALIVGGGFVSANQEKPQLPKSQLPDLGRPTKVAEEQPPFNIAEFFAPKWSLDCDAPAASRGPSGTIKSTVDDKHAEGPSFEAATTAAGPGGPFTVKESIAL